MINKNFLSITLALIMTFGMCSAAFASGDIPDGYTPIYTAEDLNNIRNNLSGKYILMNDIDLSDYENWEPIGSETQPFTGALNGDGYGIINLVSKSGFFDCISGALISNLVIRDCNINEYIVKKHRGIIADKSYNSEFKNCYTSGSIFASTGNGVIDIAYDFWQGGLAGFSESTHFKNCYSNVDFSLEYTVMYPYAAGGLVGQAKDSDFVCCYTISEFNETFIGYGNTEGLDIYTGGLAGNSVSGNKFENCYFSDNSAFAIGTPEVTPQGTEALSNDALKLQASFEGFDFNGVWTMAEEGYPELDFTKIKQNIPEKPSVSLVDAKIVKIPFKKRIVFGQLPKSPEGITVELKYSDGTTVTDKITLSDDEYYVNGECITEAVYAAVEKYGVKNAGLYLNEGEIHLSYKYLALPSIIDLFRRCV